MISLMVAVFLRSGLVTHLIGDEHARGRVLRSYFRIIVPHAMTYGRVDVIGNGQAAAIWYRHDDTGLSAIPGYAARLAEQPARTCPASSTSTPPAPDTTPPAGRPAAPASGLPRRPPGAAR